MIQNILFITNPTSQSLDKQVTEEIISEFALIHKFKWKTYYTEKENTKAKIRIQIEQFNPDLVIAVGGDGTINQVAEELLNSPIQLGIIPAGSANGLAYNLDIPAVFKDALYKTLASNPKPFDAIRLNETWYCFHLSDIGINARTVKRFEKERSKGMLGYGKHMIRELSAKKKVFSFTLITNGNSKKYRGEMLIIANARAYGTGAVINPEGKTDDGKFEIIIIKPYPWWSIFKIVTKIFMGKPHQLEYVKIIRTHKAHIRFSKPQDMQTDGEVIENISSLRAVILPSALKIRY